MAEECAICKREIGDLEEGPYSWDDGDKLRYMCKACNDKQGVVEGGPKAWQSYQEGDNYITKYGGPRFDPDEEKEQRLLQEQDDERARATGERESDYSKDK
jgi:hypothetical protein